MTGIPMANRPRINKTTRLRRCDQGGWLKPRARETDNRALSGRQW